MFENLFPPSARPKYPAKCDAQLTESNFQTRSSIRRNETWNSSTKYIRNAAAFASPITAGPRS
ncbi:DUF6783 domain-containing protein [uncultured Clostridium sp.]|uniref:DUF6783 domain-containing protein n=1 Tax=uncultured Clostridium sp. TaxID=59620 RepID=UPI00345A9D23